VASVRDAFFNKIYDLVKAGEDIYIVTADLGAPTLDDFRRDFPERYISVGIAEQCLIAVAAGLALAGKKVIAYGLNPFPITRAFDQVRSLMAELDIPVTLCALNAGFCSAECGYTHMPIEDMAMMRTLSNVRVINPTDENISVKIAEEMLISKKPTFIRFDKSINGKMYHADNIDFKTGFMTSSNSDSYKVGVITNGCYAKELNSWIHESKRTKDIQLFDLFALPIDEEKMIAEISKCQKLITVEENVLTGGIGSLVLELLSDRGINKTVKRLGVDLKRGYYDVFTNRDYIRKDQNIDIESVVYAINSLL
jgi:transketolase